MFVLTNLSNNANKFLLTIDITNAIIEKDKINFILEPIFDKLLKNKDYESRKQVAQTLDRYILHTLEELYEFRDEYRNLRVNNTTDNKHLTNEELVDVISYLVTILSLLQQSRYNEVTLEISYDPSRLFNVFTTSDFIFENLMVFRRLFPLRKWQYKNKYEKISSISELTKLYRDAGNNDDLDELAEHIKAALKFALLIFIVININNSNNFDKIIDQLNDIFTMKSNYIYNKIYNLYK